MAVCISELSVDYALFAIALGYDFERDPYPMSAFLNRATGEVVIVFDSDNDAPGNGFSKAQNREDRIRVKLSPDLFLGIEPHGWGVDDEAVQLEIKRFLDEHGLVLTVA